MPANNSCSPLARRLLHKPRLCFALALTGLMLWLALPPAYAGVTLTNLVLFDGTNGANPQATLVQGADGNFYGTTYNGGTNGGYGTVFQMTGSGVLTTLFSFNGTNGANPQATLVQAADGSFFGTTCNGGANGDNGTVFQITSNSTFATLFSFNNTNGANPQGALTLGADGNFYGTTFNGGDDDLGTVFKITTNGVLTTLFSFNGTNGANPQGALTLGVDGNFYGTTSAGGANDDNGTVFRMTSGGLLTTLLSFNGTNGSFPYAGLMSCPDGKFYGATVGGGADGSINGTLFQITTNGSLTTMVSFNNTNGATPYDAPILGADGNFYGITTAGGAANNNFGTIFEMTTNGALTTLYSFIGAFPFGGLVQGKDGNFYGTTFGGTAHLSGTIFRLTVPPAPPVIQSVTRSNQTIHIVWSAVIGQQYQVEYTTSLNPPAWHNLGSSVTATSITATASDSIGPDPQRFYRVALLLNTPPPPPVIQSLTQSGAKSLALKWSAVAGQKYQVKYSSSLNPPAWQNLGAPVTATDSTSTAFDSIGPDPQRFYCLVMLP